MTDLSGSIAIVCIVMTFLAYVFGLQLSKELKKVVVWRNRYNNCDFKLHKLALELEKCKKYSKKLERKLKNVSTDKTSN